jgi:hypothetical protein
MKKSFLNLIFFIFPALVLIVGCGKKLDIEPAQSVDQTLALTTSSDIKGTLVGAYSQMGNANLFGGRFYVNADLLADDGDLLFTGTFQDLTQIANKDIPVDNGFITSAWLAAYSAINVTNNVLAVIDRVDAVSRDRVAAEAKFIRGSLYFELVKAFAKSWGNGSPATNPGVPLVLTPTQDFEGATKDVARNTVAEVYAQIIKDLTEAESKLPSTNGFFATKWAAAAMLSRVYLSQSDYANARDAANRVINSGQFRLTLTYADEFPTPGQIRVLNTVEDIFAIQVSEQSGTNSLNQFYAASNYGGRGDIEMLPQHFDRYEADDDRLSLFYDDAGSIRTAKFNNQFGNIKVLRLAEMYLTRAECNFRLGTSIGDSPLNDINLIRERVFLNPLTVAQLNINSILNERYLELAFEGQRLADLKRTKRSIIFYDDQGNITASIPFNDPHLVYPIPQRELLVNKALSQNDGY